MSAGLPDLLRVMATHAQSALRRKPLRVSTHTWIDLPQWCQGSGIAVAQEHRYRVRLSLPTGECVVAMPDVIPVRDSAVALAQALVDVDATLRESTAHRWSLEEFQLVSLQDATVDAAIRGVLNRYNVGYPCSLDEWEGLAMLPALLAATAVGALARESLLSGPTWSAPSPRDPAEEVLSVLLEDQSALPHAPPEEWVSAPVFMWGELRALTDRRLLSVAHALSARH